MGIKDSYYPNNVTKQFADAGVKSAAVVNVGNAATGTELATAINGILAALRAAGIVTTP